MKQDLMKGVIDMHVHTNPDLRLRAYDDFELMEAAIRVGARAIVIKTHQGTTMDRAYLCEYTAKEGYTEPCSSCSLCWAARSSSKTRLVPSMG